MCKKKPHILAFLALAYASPLFYPQLLQSVRGKSEEADWQEMERKRPQDTGRKVRLRTLADLDKRTTAARAALELRAAITDDLGGEHTLSAMKRAVVHNAAVLGAMLEDMAAAYLGGEGTDLSLYATLANAQRRLLVDLGLERRAQDITPDLRNYIKGRERAA